MLPMELLYKVLVGIIYKIVWAWKTMKLKSSSKKKINCQKEIVKSVNFRHKRLKY